MIKIESFVIVFLIKLTYINFILKKVKTKFNKKYLIQMILLSIYKV